MKAREYATAVVDRAIQNVGGIASFAHIKKAERKRRLAWAAEELKYQYPDEYETCAVMKTAMSLYRMPGGRRADLKRALAESEEVRLGNHIIQQTGQVVILRLREYNLASIAKGVREQVDKPTPVTAVVHTNGANHTDQVKPVAPANLVAPMLIDVPPNPVADGDEANDLAQPHKSKHTDRYRTMAEMFRLLPPDDVVAYLLGCSNSICSRARETLRKEGFTFEPVSIPNSNKQWKVIVRGSEVRAEREKAAKRLADEQANQQAEALREQAKLAIASRIDTMSNEQLAKLLAGIG